MLATVFINSASADITNGDFEDGDTGWTLSGNGPTYYGDIVGLAANSSSLGLRTMAVSAEGYGYGMQTFDLSGMSNLKFDYRSPAGTFNGEARQAIGFGDMNVSSVKWQNTVITDTVWKEGNIDVSGYSGLTDIYFYSRGGAIGSAHGYFDNIELGQTPYNPPGFDGDFESGGWTYWTKGHGGSSVWPWTYSSWDLGYPYQGTYGLWLFASAVDFPFSSTDHNQMTWVNQTVDITGAEWLEFTAKATYATQDESETVGISAVTVGDKTIYVTGSDWTDYALDISSLTGNQEIKLWSYAEANGVTNDDRTQNLYIDDLVLVDVVPDIPAFTGTPYIRFNPDLNYDTVGNHMIGQRYFKFDMGITAEYVGYDYAVRYSSGASDVNDTWYYGDHGWQTPDPYGPYEYENETLDYLIQCRDGNSINLTIELFYADFAGGRIRLRNVLATDVINYNCPCYNDSPPPTPTPLPTETPTPIPTPDPTPGGNETGNESINSSGMEGYYNSVDAVFGNLSVSMKEGMGFLTSPVENLTGHINTINTSFVSSFNQSTGHKSVLLAILVPFFKYLPVEIKSLITLSIVFILILLILRGNSGGQ